MTERTKQRLRPETVGVLAELGHQVSGLEPRRERRYEHVPLNSLVHVAVLLLLEDTPLPAGEDDDARMDALLAVLDLRSPHLAPALRASVRKRAERHAAARTQARTQAAARAEGTA